MSTILLGLLLFEEVTPHPVRVSLRTPREWQRWWVIAAGLLVVMAGWAVSRLATRDS
jgi:hypothetical protein